MSCYRNNGTLELKGVTKKNWDAVQTAFNEVFNDGVNDFGTPVVSLDGKQVVFDDCIGGNLDEDIAIFCEKLGKVGVKAVGDVRWSGDYEGFYFVANGKVMSCDIEYKALYTAPIPEIKATLKDRGYKAVITKIGKTKNTKGKA